MATENPTSTEEDKIDGGVANDVGCVGDNGDDGDDGGHCARPLSIQSAPAVLQHTDADKLVWGDDSDSDAAGAVNPVAAASVPGNATADTTTKPNVPDDNKAESLPEPKVYRCSHRGCFFRSLVNTRVYDHQMRKHLGQICYWHEGGKEGCLHVAKSNEELHRHFTECHLQMEGPEEGHYVCPWPGNPRIIYLNGGDHRAAPACRRTFTTKKDAQHHARFHQYSIARTVLIDLDI